MRIAVVLVLVLLLVAPAAATSTSGPATARAVLLTQVSLFRQGKFKAMYTTTYTPTYRAHCPWSAFKRGQTALKRYLGPGFTLRRVRTRMLSARRALLAYQLLRRDGTVAGTATFQDHDLYVKTGGRWYDEYDGKGC